MRSARNTHRRLRAGRQETKGLLVTVIQKTHTSVFCVRCVMVAPDIGVDLLEAFGTECPKRNDSAAALAVHAGNRLFGGADAVLDAALADPCLDLAQRNLKMLGNLILVDVIGTDIVLDIAKQICFRACGAGGVGVV